MKDLRSPNQIAVSDGMKRHWRRRKAGVCVPEDDIQVAINIAERARLDRPEKVGNRRRCGDVIRWKMNNETIDQIVGDLKALHT